MLRARDSSFSVSNVGLSDSWAWKHEQVVLLDRPVAVVSRPVNMTPCALRMYLAQRCSETWVLGVSVVVWFEVTSSLENNARVLVKHFLKRLAGKSIL